jgi:glycosyltransferase involved in cell wall biosynthesis
MRILQVCPRYFPDMGGVEEHVRNISERLSKKYEVSVFTTDPSGKLPKRELINSVEVVRSKSWPPNGMYYISGELVRRLVGESENYDIVHAHDYHAFPALYAAYAKNRNKLVFTSHYHGKGNTFFRSLLHIPYKFFGGKIFEKADKIICVSNYEKSLVVNLFKIGNEKVTVIPNGVDLQEFRGLKKRKTNFKVILYVGRLEKYKGVHYLIKALRKLDNNIILEIVGKGPCKKSLVKLTRKLGVEDRVRFYQDLPRKVLLNKYVNADIFVFLSKLEAFGISVAEAIASKIPCILANTSALKEWVDNENCFGIDYPIDIDELTWLINRVIAKENEGVGMKLKGEKLWSWEKVVRELEKVYES